ncbi:MAG TPA: ATP-binding protein [Streptosporangiaceae bacterium]|nr:ATP-binding protein [Streptosporangiaceae bacterium]
MATVEMTFTPLPAHVRTARLVATAVARRSGVHEALLDEVRLAVGEACSRAVEVHQASCPHEPVRVALTGADGRFEVVVTNNAANGGDRAGEGWTSVSFPDAVSTSPPNGGVPTAAPGEGLLADAGGHGEPDLAGLPTGTPEELGLAVIAGLADDVHVSRSGSGVSIRMSWPTADQPSATSAGATG